MNMIQKFIFSKKEVIVVKTCNSGTEIDAAIEYFFKFFNKLPPDKSAKIVLKPNFNNDINGLMSNSTDLRVIFSITKYLIQNGYQNIIITDGPNGGIVRQGINVFKRLRVDRFANALEVKYLDLNNDSGRQFTLTNNEPVEVSETCLNSDVLINIPKIKTHWEAGLTLATKNLMGCLKKFSKKSVHYNFFPNLLRINELIKPNFHIVDGLIAMEGQGPGDGRPKKLNLLIAGKNNYLIDLVITRLAGFDISDVGYLKLALEGGLISQEDAKIASEIDQLFDLKKARQSKITKFATARWLTPVRSFFRPIFQSPTVNRFLQKRKIIQDIYVKEDDSIESLSFNNSKCDNCQKCTFYCPMRLNPKKQLNDPLCIQCLYCFMVCPKKAITIKGELGFLKSQLDRFYDSLKNL